MTTQHIPATEPTRMIYPFPQPGKLVQLAYRELHIAVNGTPDQQGQLGNHALLPRQWEPATWLRISRGASAARRPSRRCGKE